MNKNNEELETMKEEVVKKIREKLKKELAENKIKMLVEFGKTFCDEIENGTSSIYVKYEYEEANNHFNEWRVALDNDSVPSDEYKNISNDIRCISIFFGDFENCVTILFEMSENGDILDRGEAIFMGNVFIYGDGDVQPAHSFSREDKDGILIEFVQSAFSDEEFRKELGGDVFKLSKLYDESEKENMLEDAGEGVVDIGLHGDYAVLTILGGLSVVVEKDELRSAIIRKKHQESEAEKENA